MSWRDIVELLPIELVEEIFSFLSIKNDLPILNSLISDPHLNIRTKQVIFNRILRFVVIDPSFWAKEFSSVDFWYPSLKEFKLLLVSVCDQKVPITTHIQLCIHHNFTKNRVGIEEFAEFLGGEACTPLVNIKCRLYMKERFENIADCVQILKSNNVFHRVTHLELVSTTEKIQGAELPVETTAKTAATVSTFPVIHSLVRSKIRQ